MSPIGQELHRRQSFEIVGVYAGKYGGKLNTNDQMLIMPYTLQSLMMSSQGMSRPSVHHQGRKMPKTSRRSPNRRSRSSCSRAAGKRRLFSAPTRTVSLSSSRRPQSNLMALLGGGIAKHLAARRRYRHYEYHAGVCYRAHTRNRHPYGNRRPQARHHRSVPCGGGGRELLRRHHRHCARLLCLGGARQVHACPSLQQNMYLPNVEQFTVLPSVGIVLGAFLFFRSARHHLRSVPCQQGIQSSAGRCAAHAIKKGKNR